MINKKVDIDLKDVTLDEVVEVLSRVISNENKEEDDRSFEEIMGISEEETKTSKKYTFEDVERMACNIFELAIRDLGVFSVESNTGEDGKFVILRLENPDQLLINLIEAIVLNGEEKE